MLSTPDTCDDIIGYVFPRQWGALCMVVCSVLPLAETELFRSNAIHASLGTWASWLFPFTIVPLDRIYSSPALILR